MAVYMIRAGVIGLVKIGFGYDPTSRLRSIQPPTPAWTWIMRLFEGGRPEERALHERFRLHRQTGEWFRFHQDMLGDLGLRELPIPRVKHNGPRCYDWPENAARAEDFFHQDVLGIIGGGSALAAALGEPLGAVIPGRQIASEFWSAAALLARSAGHPEITFRLFQAFREANNAEHAAWEASEKQRTESTVLPLDGLAAAKKLIAERGALLAVSIRNSAVSRSVIEPAASSSQAAA